MALQGNRWILAALLLASGMCGGVSAQDVAPAQKVAPGDAIRTCTRCHDESEEKPVLSILKSRHAVMADARTPFADQACMTCHGPSKAHLQAPPPGSARRNPPDVVFGKQSGTPVQARNEKCLGCHESGMRMHWKGSRHEAVRGDADRHLSLLIPHWGTP